MQNTMRARGRALIALVPLALVAGCSAAPAPHTSTHSTEATVTVPDFSGPWAGELADAYRRAASDFERKALSDGEVTDAEFSEMEQRHRACLENKGVGFSGFNPDGSYNFQAARGMTSKEANAIADDCSVTSGVNTVKMIHDAMRSNPQNLDVPTIMASCLVKKQVVPPGYNADDYSRDTPTSSYPFRNKDAGQKALTTCSADPLGLLGLEP